jgi:lipopolysaccharide export system permease protein
MSRFDRYLLSQLMMFFGFFALVLVSIYWVNSAVRLFDRLMGEGQSVWVFLEMTALSLPNVVRLVLPIAAFVAVIYTVNRMADESELVVLQATGFSSFRLARPALLFGLIVALLMAALTHFLVPASRARLNDWNDQISRNVSSKFLSERTFLHPAAGITLYIRAIEPTGELRDILLTDSREPAQTTTYNADRAFLVKSAAGPKLVMFAGLAQTLRRADSRLSVTRFDDFTYDVGALISARGPRIADLDERPTRALLAPDGALLAETGVTAAKAMAEGHDRFAKPLLALTAALVAFAAMLNGGFSRSGQWPQVALASGFFIALFFLMNAANKFAAVSEAAVTLVYLPVLAGLAAAALLLAWSGRTRRSPNLTAAA